VLVFADDHADQRATPETGGNSLQSESMTQAPPHELISCLRLKIVWSIKNENLPGQTGLSACIARFPKVH
jgi:hypothetical protein